MMVDKHEPLFWCVWCENAGRPTVKHSSFQEAKAEAQRLARNNPGSRFVVMAAALAYQKRDLDEIGFHGREPPWGDPMDEEIPF